MATFTGDATNNTFNGTTDSDSFYGFAGNDILRGYEGYDYFEGGLGDDVIDGGSEQDTASYSDATAGVTVNLSITGAQNTGWGSDTLLSIENLTGSAFNDTLTGNITSNNLYGGDGDDILRGGEGYDYLSGGNGNDQLFGGYDGDYFDGGAGNDRLDGGPGSDWAYYYGAPGAVRVDLAVTAAQNTGYGVDTLVSIENVSGGSSGDTLLGNSKDNSISGYDGNDQLYGRAGNDYLNGDAGNDYLNGGAGNDYLYGNDGTDVASYFDASSGVSVDLAVTSSQDTHWGFDTLSGIENLIGSGYNDTLNGDDAANSLLGLNGNDTLVGRGGNDVLNGGAGADAMAGGAGNDTYTVDNAADKVFEAVGGGTDKVLASVNYALQAGQELEFLFANAGSLGLTLAGNEFNNTVVGGNGNDTLNGGAGNDALNAGAGDDFLIGGTGNDTLLTGAGADTILFNTALGAAFNVDHITDFVAADDTMRLENSIFTALTTTGTLAANAFFAGAGVNAAHDADDRVIYNTTTGALFYDADGTGAGGATVFAVLNTHPAITNADFFVI